MITLVCTTGELAVNHPTYRSVRARDVVRTNKNNILTIRLTDRLRTTLRYFDPNINIVFSWNKKNPYFCVSGILLSVDIARTDGQSDGQRDVFNETGRLGR
ncbi:hypothetical protein J6590_023195 [Homalodisca vitripennis]|nr:hypothetical protein J6590_023195 [Homalodisca vitripennis]